MKYSKIIFTYLILLNYSYLIHSYPYFNKCAEFESNLFIKVLNTLNGKIKGECYNVPVSYSNGSKIYSNVFNWLSIPFAEPPINENRFKDPIPKKQWTTTLDGTVWPNACMQSGPRASSEDCLYLNIFAPANAYLNRTSQLVPILVYIHGGGFTAGRTANDKFEGSTLAAHSGVIVITIQYRVDSFGFLHLSDSDAIGNQGFLDQHLALRWIYENADRFGGDRSKITLSGESAGSFSVGFHLFYEKSWPYFRNAIMESGGPTSKGFPLLSSAEATRRAKELFSVLGCSVNSSNSEILKCAQSLSTSSILNATYSYLMKKVFLSDFLSSTSVTVFPLVLNNVTFAQSINQALIKGAFKKCKIITGFTSDEYGFFIANTGALGADPSQWEQNARAINSSQAFDFLDLFFYFYPSYPERSGSNLTQNIIEEYFPKENSSGQQIAYVSYLSQIASDFIFVCQSFEMAEAYAKSKLDAYVYSYNHRISSTIFPEVLGVVHTDELAMVFAETLSSKIPPILTPDNFWSSIYNNYSSTEKRFNEEFLTYWTSFIKYDDPNYLIVGESKKWRPFVNSSINLNKLDAVSKMNAGSFIAFKADNIKMNTGFSSHKCAFWNYTLNNANSLSFSNILVKIALVLNFCILFRFAF